MLLKFVTSRRVMRSVGALSSGLAWVSLQTIRMFKTGRTNFYSYADHSVLDVVLELVTRSGRDGGMVSAKRAESGSNG